MRVSPFTRMTAVLWHASPPSIQPRRARKVGRAGTNTRPAGGLSLANVRALDDHIARRLDTRPGGVDDDVLALDHHGAVFPERDAGAACGEDHLVAGIDQELLGDAQAVVLADRGGAVPSDAERIAATNLDAAIGAHAQMVISTDLGRATVAHAVAGIAFDMVSELAAHRGAAVVGNGRGLPQRASRRHLDSYLETN